MSVVEDQRQKDDTGVTEFNEKYEIKRCADWISINRYRKVCLQFPDELLHAAVDVISQLQIYTDAEFYVSADATFRSCCLDFKTANHVNADALIHFGRTCSSRFQSNSIASLFILPKEYLNVDALCECVTSFVEQKRCNVVLLYDIAFAHYADKIDDRLSELRSNISLSRLLVNEDVNCDTTSSEVENQSNVVKKFGRQYHIEFPDGDRELVYIYVISPSSQKNFDNFLFSLPENSFYAYDSSTNSLSEQFIPKTIKKTLFQVEKVKQARRIGILVATLEAHLFLDAVQRIKKLCTLKKKKAYIISVGKMNVAKLANFPEIDVFVMISCPEVEITNRKDYFQTIVSMMELELALNDNHQWSGKFVADFSEFLPDGSEYKPMNENTSNLDEAQADVSLLNNRLIGLTSVNDQGSSNAVIQSCNTVLAINESQYDLANRTWTGLQTQITDDIPVSIATAGRKGAPAAGYETPSSDHVT